MDDNQTIAMMAATIYAAHKDNIEYRYEYAVEEACRLGKLAGLQNVRVYDVKLPELDSGVGGDRF
jgi:hypothetical protein